MDWESVEFSLVLHSAKTNLLADSMVEKHEVYHLLLIGTYMNRLPGFFAKAPLCKHHRRIWYELLNAYMVA